MSFKAWKDCGACYGRGHIEPRRTNWPEQCQTCEAHFAEVEQIADERDNWRKAFHESTADYCKKINLLRAEIEDLRGR